MEEGTTARPPGPDGNGAAARAPQVVFVPLAGDRPGELLNDTLPAPATTGDRMTPTASPPPFTAAPVPVSALGVVAPTPVRVVPSDGPSSGPSVGTPAGRRSRRRHPAARSRAAAATISGTAAVGLVVVLGSATPVNGVVASATRPAATGSDKVSSSTTPTTSTTVAPLGEPTAATVPTVVTVPGAAVLPTHVGPGR